ncbi:MAG: hypothetical protein IT381_01685 [Deltaproteobacteria bacterium]|nr:hypothetical protein [Deltaproteobacteria bacterium]
MHTLLLLLLLAAPKPITLTRSAGAWTLSAPKSCKQIQGKTIALVPAGADWGELRTALFPLFECGPQNLVLGAVPIALPSKQTRPIVIVKNDSLWLWHEGARTKIDGADPDAIKSITAAGVAVYFAPTVMLAPATLDRVKNLGPLELADTKLAGVRVTAGETARAETIEKPSGALVRVFGSAEMPVAGAAPPPSWTTGGPRRCYGKGGAPVAWAAGVAAGIFDPAKAREAADAAAKAEMAKFLDATAEPPKKGKPAPPAEVVIIDHYDDAASRTNYALAETAILKKRGEELDTCFDADPGVTWTWQAVDTDGGVKRAPPEWAKGSGLSGHPLGLHFRYIGVAKSPYANERAAAESALLSAMRGGLAKICATAVVDGSAIAAAEWFAEQQLGAWTFRATLAWAPVPESVYGGCARQDGEIALGRPPPMQNAPGWVSRGASETNDAFFVATKDGDTNAIWATVHSKLAPALPEGWPSQGGTAFLAKAIAKDATGTQTWRDPNYGVDYALRRVPKIAIAQRLKECQTTRACETLADEKKAIEQLQRGLSAVLAAQAASQPAK